MKRFSIIFAAAAVMMAQAPLASANVWIDENFDGANTFVQGNGSGPAGATLDTYSSNALANPISNVMTHTGTVTTVKKYNGTKSYKLAPGQAITVGEPYQDQGNGNFLLLQMAVNVDPIPAAGTVGEIRWNFNYGTTPTNYSFFTRLVSTGTAVNIVAGQDQPTTLSTTSATIDTLNTVNSWTYITMRMEKQAPSDTDSRFNDGPILQGMHFYSSSNTESLFIPLSVPDGTSDKSKGLSISATGGTMYIDSLYFDGGQEDQAGTSNPRPFNSAKLPPAAVSDWSVY